MFMIIAAGYFFSILAGIMGVSMAQRTIAPLLGPYAEIIQSYLNSLL